MPPAGYAYPVPPRESFPIESSRRCLDELDELLGAMARRVRIEGTLARRFADAPQLFRAGFERVDHILSPTRHQKLASGIEELIQSFPPITHDGRFAGCGFK